MPHRTPRNYSRKVFGDRQGVFFRRSRPLVYDRARGIIIIAHMVYGRIRQHCSEDTAYGTDIQRDPTKTKEKKPKKTEKNRIERNGLLTRYNRRPKLRSVHLHVRFNISIFNGYD